MTRNTTALAIGAVLTASALVHVLAHSTLQRETPLRFDLVAPGVWKATIGKPDDLTLAFDEYITAVGNSGFAGVLWSPEVRGGDGEDMLRRMQAVCFSPLALFNGWAIATKLWSHPEVADQERRSTTSEVS
jgi:hypothetical protein